MHIQKRRIRSVARYFGHLNRNHDTYIYSLLNDTENQFDRVGLAAQASMGDTILPSIVGPVSRFNAEGREHPDKNQPKETRVISQRVWRWVDYQGHEYDRIVNIERECYPKILTPPPAVEMQVLSVEGQLRLVSVIPANSADETITHTVNLYLEFFRECHVTDDATAVPIINPTRVNWRLLPAGTHPWDQAKEATQLRIASKSDDAQFIILDRQRHVCSLHPDRVYVGQGGFSDYLAYEFTNKKLVVLESLVRGNAIYIFDTNWAAFSKHTKRDILTNNLHVDRIVHATGWKDRLQQVLA